MQLELAFLERPVEPDDGSNGPWDQIDRQAQIAALVVLSRLIAQKLVSKVARESGVRPLEWTGSGCGFDRLPGVLILELRWAQVAKRGV